LLEIKDLSFRIGDSQILNNLSFSVKTGERIGIIGPNGSGKTTMFNCISGFNKPQAGSIRYKGEEFLSLNPSGRAKKGIGRLFQNFGIFRSMTVEENVLVAIEARARAGILGSLLSKRKYRDEIISYLSRVGLESKRSDKAGSLSGGQLRLLEIIRLIAFGANVFLLDEPTAGVSPRMKITILDALKDLLEPSAIVLLIEHDIRFIQDFCDRVLVLNGGQVVLDGSPEEVQQNPLLQEIYFGTKAESALDESKAEESGTNNA
jgi:branched-chain amino acid transport system ATP-binding protein